MEIAGIYIKFEIASNVLFHVGRELGGNGNRCIMEQGWNLQVMEIDDDVVLKIHTLTSYY